MDWQQKFAAIKAFDPYASLEMRQPGDWYVGGSLSIGGDGVLVGRYGEGDTPPAAVDAHWAIYSALPSDRYAVNRENKRARWNGFMWIEVSEDEASHLLGRKRSMA